MKKKTMEQETVENEAGATTENEADEVVLEEQKPENEAEGTAEKEISEETVDELAELKDRHVRLYSEFENFRRRTAKEKLEVIATANADLIVALLPVLDDFERAMKAFEEAKNTDSLEGINLIYTKLRKSLDSFGLKEIEAGTGSKFDVEIHEAISQIPAPSKKLKGKIIDVVEKGYFIKDKVIRFAKVVVGS